MLCKITKLMNFLMKIPTVSIDFSWSHAGIINIYSGHILHVTVSMRTCHYDKGYQSETPFIHSYNKIGKLYTNFKLFYFKVVYF